MNESSPTIETLIGTWDLPRRGLGPLDRIGYWTWRFDTIHDSFRRREGT